MENIKEIIKKRTSVRTYDERPLTGEDREKLEKFLDELDNPFDTKIEFRFLDGKTHKLSSPVIVGCNFYIAAKVTACDLGEVAYGYSFEKFCLYAASLGIGTVMLGGTLSRKSFEKAMELTESEIMPIASPVGYPAEKKSLRERMMRKAIKADERQPFEKLFFEDSFDFGLTKESAGRFADALEMVRLAPSAVNKQPWRVVKCGDTLHFFKKKSLGASESFDMQKIDIGIALAHFDLALKEDGISGSFMAKEPSFEVDDSMEYMVSFVAKH